MRLDNYNVAAFETFEPLHGASGEAPPPESVVAEEAPGPLLREMAQQQPIFVRLPEPEPGPRRLLPRLDDGDRLTLRQREPQQRFEPGGGVSGGVQGGL